MGQVPNTPCFNVFENSTLIKAHAEEIEKRGKGISGSFISHMRQDYESVQ
jgi:hypothetical protein